MGKSELPVRFEYAKAGHIKQIFDIEKDTFSLPWSFESIKKDVLENKLSIYIVGLLGEEVVSYAGFWQILEEAHIMNIAVKEQYRKRGIGSAMLCELVDVAQKKDVSRISLEVRENNNAAIRMYENAGFRAEGTRKGYYTDTGENALIMVKNL